MIHWSDALIEFIMYWIIFAWCVESVVIPFTLTGTYKHGLFRPTQAQATHQSAWPHGKLAGESTTLTLRVHRPSLVHSHNNYDSPIKDNSINRAV
jgi:hypothetical protein